MLALEDVPNGGGEVTPRGRQSSEPGMALVGQELVPVKRGTVADEQQFMTPARGKEEGEMNPSDVLQPPQSMPKALAPTPLFSEKQLSLMDEMYHRTSSPLLPQGMPSLVQRSLPEMPTQRGIVDERSRMAQEMLNPPLPRDLPQPEVFNIGSRSSSDRRLETSASDDHLWKIQVGRELRNMGEKLSKATEENRALKEEIALIRLENRFYTPESEKVKPKPSVAQQSTGVPRSEAREGNPTAEPSQMELLMLMQNMKEIQRHMLSRDDHGASNGVEVVRSGVIDLPKLAEWDSQEGPLKMGDWMALLEPAISDLSTSGKFKTGISNICRWLRLIVQLTTCQPLRHSS